MKIVRSFPHQVRAIENLWISMSDGVSLAARAWLPEDADKKPVPAIFEYMPYRKRDCMRGRDAIMHRYFAGHGYASLRVDLRGSGDSGGVLKDEYLEQELQDGLELIDWISRQPWCNGHVGSIGKSWGGFNALQLAALNPPALKAVIAVCASDDRYADDVHHMGGCVLGDNLSWASTMFAYNSCPPDPEIVGDDWRKMWFERLQGSGLWLETWLKHQRRDAYWKHGSIGESFEAVRCPVFVVSGWADGYTNAVFRLLAGLSVPRKGLVGPWSHKYPHEGLPGPAIGFLQEAVRWWDQWLKDIETGIMQEPMLRAWMQDTMEPFTFYEERPGRWVSEPSWPSPHIETARFVLSSGYALESATNESRSGAPLPVQSPLSVGLFAGKWCSCSAPPDLPGDQREEDGGSLVFETHALEEALEILGMPMLELELSANKPVAQVAARLSDVAPDRKATRVTYGLLNLTHRESDEDPQPLEPGQRYRVRVKLNYMGQVFPKGHRLRVSISTSYWPLAWPAPAPAQLNVYTGSSVLLLPVRVCCNGDEETSPFGEPEGAAPIRESLIKPPRYDWIVHRNLGTDVSTLEVIRDDGVFRLDEIDLNVEARSREWYSYTGDDFNSLTAKAQWVRSFVRDQWSVKTETYTVLTSSNTDFHLHAQLDAYERGRRVYSDNWHSIILRDLV